MSERDVVLSSKTPITRTSLAHDLRKLGLKEGDTIIAHTSMSKLGWVVGREVTILDAILDVLGDSGTLIMPAQTGENSDPTYWENPPVPSEWIDIIKENMPAFDPKRTPTRSMGKVVDNLLMHPACMRSNHPQVSFCGIGPLAKHILDNHPLAPGLGLGSPLHKLYELDAKILLLGVGYGNCTSLHLPESQISTIITHKTGSKMLVDGVPKWVEYEEICYNDEDFESLGEDFEKEHSVNKYKIGNYTCRLINAKELCDFAIYWLNEHRK